MGFARYLNEFGEIGYENTISLSNKSNSKKNIQEEIKKEDVKKLTRKKSIINKNK